MIKKKVKLVKPFKGLIYKATIIVPGGQSYIGLTSVSLQDRMYDHIYDAYHGSGYYFAHAVLYYGQQNVLWEVLQENIKTPQLLKQRQKFYILKYDTYVSKEEGSGGYNLTLGGEGMFGFKHTEETKQYLSFIMMAQKNPFFNKKHTEETKKIMSQRHWDCSGQNNPMWHHQFTQLHRKRLSDNHADVSGQKNPAFGKPVPQERRDRISKSLTGPNNPMYGKKQNKEHVEKRANALKGVPQKEQRKKNISEALKRYWENIRNNKHGGLNV